ncbi:MAG: RDD family protein [Planctomycetes bacterium]|nr:RDD family protein [Planctomycetota bacterium]
MAAVRPIFTDATRPDTNVERVGTLAYSHPIVLPEDVQARFEVASPPLRAAALAIDLIIITVISVALVFLLLGAWLAQNQWLMALQMILFFLVNVGYFFIFETFMSGQTPGKRLMKLRVITEEGEEIGAREGLIRSFTRIIEIGPTPSLLVFGRFNVEVWLAVAPFIFFALVVFIDKRCRRLGDFAAGTLVVRQKQPTEYGDTVRIAGYFELQQRFFALSSAELARLSPEDYVKLEEFGSRIRTVNPATRMQAAMAAAMGMAQKMQYGHPIAPEHSERFLFEVHAALKEQLRQLYPDLYG